MLKINALLQDKSPYRDICIQTDLPFTPGTLFPKMRVMLPRPSDNKNAQNMSYHNDLSPNRLSKQAQKSSIHLKYLKSHKCIMKTQQAWNQNALERYKNSKQMIKQFRFIKNNDNQLQKTVIKCLNQQNLSKHQTSKMNEIVSFTFLRVQPHKQNQTQPIFNKKSKNNGTAKTIIFQTDFTSLVEKTKQLLENKYPSCKQHALNKKVSLFVQSLINDKQIITVVISQKKYIKSQPLQVYLSAYIQANSSKYQHFMKHGFKHFYQQMFNRYQQVPFSKEEYHTEPIQMHIQDVPKPATKKVSLIFKRPQKNSKDVLSQQFLRLRFHDNLRKQVKKLTADTNQILNDQMTKINCS